MKPRIFIGSSSENLSVAFAIQENLDGFSYPTVWEQNVFSLSNNTLQDLIKHLSETDFAIFVFHPDDKTRSRKKEFTSIRDNIIFETGLFMGRLGQDKVFFVKPRSIANLKIPSDLLGINAGSYDDSRDNLKAALGPFCNQIRGTIKKIFSGSNKEMPSVKNSMILDNFIKYEIDIRNNDGDVKVKKTISSTITEGPITERTHEIFCDITPMAFNEMNLSAYDNKKKPLFLLLEKDQPHRKTFNVHFKKELNEGDSIEYSFSYNWKKFYPSKEEYFTFRNPAQEIFFIIKYPRKWEMQYLNAKQNINGVQKRAIKLDNRSFKKNKTQKIEEFVIRQDKLDTIIDINWRRL